MSNPPEIRISLKRFMKLNPSLKTEEKARTLLDKIKENHRTRNYILLDDLRKQKECLDLSGYYKSY